MNMPKRSGFAAVSGPGRLLLWALVGCSSAKEMPVRDAAPEESADAAPASDLRVVNTVEVSPGGSSDAPAPDVAVADSAPGLPGSMRACGPLSLSANVKVAGYDTDQFRWADARCKPREAALVRVGGGYVRQFVYDVDGKPRVATGTGASGHTGWGYTVNHWGNTSTDGKDLPGTFKPLFVGPHHALYEYTYAPPMSGTTVKVTQHWFFTTGRDNPVVATTFDLTGIPAGIVSADTRTPYGDLAWDGDENKNSTVVDGVGWGDRYKFVTTSAPLTMNSKWDYSRPNTVPYVLEWTTRTDAEMGAVQTQTMLQHDAGGYWFYDNWGKTSDNPGPKKDGQAGLMPVTWNWTYQLDQYELCFDDPKCVNATTNSHRLAWGSNYGAVGGTMHTTNYAAYGDDKMLSGHPFQSYSVFMVLGKHSDTPVEHQVADIETVQLTHLTASTGTVRAMGPGGVGRTDAVPLSPAGYDPRYAVWNVDAAGGKVALHVSVDRGTLASPILVISGYPATTVPTVKIDGVVQSAGDLAVSVDPAGKQAWVTFPAGWTGAHDLEIQ
jgi:hypothetical protein